MTEQAMQAFDSSYAEIQKVIADNSAVFQRPGVLSVEPGTLFINGWPTSVQAIVVRVMRKIPLSELDPEERLPRRLGGYRVDVVPASPTEQLAALNAPLAAAAPQPLAAAANPYKPIPGDPINKVFEISKPILCHASPDAGWPTLKKFLNGVQDRLTIAMYDFNAEYIAREIILDVETSNAQVELVLDPQENADELEIQKRLKERLPENYELGLASVGPNQNFRSAYHEKVVIRDGSAFWLSSGNFSVSSQPDIDPFGPNPPSSSIYGLGNRDWHVIVQNGELAQVFEQYIEHDMKAAGATTPPPVAVFPDLLLPQEMFAETLLLEAAAPLPVAPRALPTPDELPVRVQPLLTPDNYIGHIYDLVQKAEKSLYLQLQYIHASDRVGDERFAELLELVGQKTKQGNFDARIIIGQGDAHFWITELQKPKWGFDPSKIKIQRRVHNKGIIVDGQIVVVGSHNWSGDGTLRNRDASLIIHNSQIAGYYQSLFLNDWESLARTDVQEHLTPLIIMPGDSTPAGMVRIPWNDFYGE